MARSLLREYLLRRLMGPSQQRRSRYGHRPVHTRRGYGWGAPRRRRHSRVHVTGCCLPIPLGLLVCSAAVGRVALRRR